MRIINMKKFTAIEGQSFSLKKDIEDIKLKLENSYKIQYATIFQIVLAIFGIILENKKDSIFLAIVIAGFIQLLILGIKKYRESKQIKDLMNSKDFIDAFDNEIVHYTLISESYCSMLAEILVNKETNASVVSEDVIHFYYIQASHYFQKAINELVPINNIVDKVLSSNAKDIIEKKLISLPRYKNLKKILEIIYKDIETYESLIKGLDRGELIIELNKNSKEVLVAIDRTVSSVLSTQ